MSLRVNGRSTYVFVWVICWANVILGQPVGLRVFSGPCHHSPPPKRAGEVAVPELGTTDVTPAYEVPISDIPIHINGNNSPSPSFGNSLGLLLITIQAPTRACNLRIIQRAGVCLAAGGGLGKTTCAPLSPEMDAASTRREGHIATTPGIDQGLRTSTRASVNRYTD